VRDPQHQAPHNVFQLLLRRRQLRRFLEANLLQPPP
jgi:hypothetical protein